MKLMKRALSMMMCIVMLVGMLPMEAFAVTTDANGVTVYEIGDSIWVRGEDNDPTEACALGTFWLPDYENDQPVTRQGLCGKTEHTHVFVCPAECALAHQHEETCYVTEYTGCTIHAHDENCVVETVYDCGKEQHENHDSCTVSQVCTVEEHDHAALNCPSEVRFTCETEVHTHSAEAGCPYETVFTCTEEHEHSEEKGCAQETRCVCTKAEHTHSVEAGCANETVYTCGKDNHAHSESCTLTTVYGCGKEIHVHDETCATKQVYPNCKEHTEHNETCATQQKLNCGKDEHTCITEGCAADCATEEHTHTDACDMDGVYYKWTVVEDTSATFEEKGLPIRFYIAAPGEAVNPNGSYKAHATELWGDSGGTDDIYAKPGTENYVGPEGTIKSKTGVRNISNEKLITDFIAGYENHAAALKTFDSFSFNGKTYSSSDYEIKWVSICYRKMGEENCTCYFYNDAHIHIDGVLTKKITPAQMKLTKTIPEAQDFAETFHFKLTKLQHVNSIPTDDADTSFGNNGSINLVAAIAANSTSASIVSPTGEEIGFGFYKLTEIVENDSRWQTKAIKIKYSDNNTQTAPTDDIYIQIGTDGTFRFCGTLNGEYAEAQEIIIENERKPLEITYSWEGIPAGLTTLPEKSTVSPGGSHTINTSYPIGTRVRGKSGVVDSDGKDTEGYYYEFLGWQYYTEGESRSDIYYENGNPGQITGIDSNVNVHGLWVRHELDKADGYITITKTFKNKPTGNALDNFYIAVIHGTHETDISPKLLGTWNDDGTQWTYDFDISESSTYQIVEGKYDVAGYRVDSNSTFAPVSGISTGTAYTGRTFESDGHSYTEIGQEITVNLPYDTSTLDGAASVANDPKFYAGTVAFTNEYTRNELTGDPVYPSFQVRKWDADYANRLTGATFELTRTDMVPAQTIPGVDKDATTVFENLQPGQYTLIETKAPDGYIKTDAVYNFTVQLDVDNEIEELRPVLCTATESATHAHTTACYAFVKIETYKIVMEGYEDEGFQGRYNPDLYRLNIPNTQIRANLKLTKTFKTASGEFKPTSGSVLVDIYGPVVRTGGTITDVGPLVRGGLAITPDTSGNWNLTVEGLPYGEYFIEEIMGSVHGYNWTDVDYHQDTNKLSEYEVGGHKGVAVSIDSINDVAVDITNTYTVWESADFYILKEDLGGKELQGAKFQLFNGTTDVTDTYKDGTNVTDVNGMVHFKGFEVALNSTMELTLKETQAPAGYYLSDRAYKVVVTHDSTGYDIEIYNADGTATGDWNHDDDVLTVINTPILGQITVKKVFAGDTVPDDTAVRFALTNADGTVTRTATITKKDGLEHTFTDLPLGDYTLTETYAAAPAGYTYTTTNTKGTGNVTDQITLYHNPETDKLLTGIPATAQAEVTFTNTYDRQEIVTVNADSLTIFKRDENGEDLAGATFGLFKDADCKIPLTSNDVSFATEVESNQYGQARFTDMKLESGEELVFYLTETEAPYGYVRNETVWKLKLSDKKVEILNNQNIFETIVDWITGLWKPKDDSMEYDWVSVDSLSVTNYRIKGTLTVNKAFKQLKDGTLSDMTEAQIGNARVEVHVHGPITRNSDNTIKDIGPLVKNINLTNGDWEDTISNLEIGEYVLREPFASIHGYTWNGVTYSGTYSDPEGNNGVSNISTVTFEGNTFALFKVSDKVNQPVISIGLENKYTPWTAADFTVNKVKNVEDPKDGLSGAKFKLYTKDDNGNYVPVAENDQFTTEATTGIAGYAYFSGFDQAGVYYLKEETAPANYYPTNNIWKVTIGQDSANSTFTTQIELAEGTSDTGWEWVGGRDVLNVENREIRGSITIQKAFQGSASAGLNSIKVSITGPNNYREVKELKPDSANAAKIWTVTLENLPMGTYYIQETDANVAGYTLTTTYYEEVDGAWVLEGYATNPAGFAQVVLADVNKQTPAASVKIENNYAKQVKVVTIPASFTIQKLDGEDRKTPLQNAEFVIKDTAGNQVGNPWVTGPDGKVTVSGLELTELQYKDYLELYEKGEKRSIKYYLSESNAPAGYKRTDMVWEITLTEDNVQIEAVDPSDNFFTAILEWIIGISKKDGTDNKSDVELGSDGVLTVYNDPIKGKITVSKSFSFKNSQNQGVDIDSNLMQNVSIQLHVHGPVVWKDSEKTQIESIGEGRPIVLDGNKITSAGMIIAELDNLPLGDYLIHETRISIHGYNWENADFKVNNVNPHVVSHDGHQYVQIEVKQDAATETAADVNVVCKNSYKAWDSADFYIYKTDDNGKELEGATFGLFFLDDANNYVAVEKDGNAVTAVTGGDGLAHFAGLTVPSGKSSFAYYVMETNAPVGYNKNETVWKVTVNTNQNTSVAGSYDMVIDDLSDHDGKDETVDDATDTITVVNEPIKATLTITKETAGDELPADAFGDGKAKIQVTVTGPENRTATLEPNKDGKLTATLTDLPLGTYTVTEDTAKAKVPGYDLIATSYEVKNGAVGNTVVFEDDRTSTATDQFNKEMVITNTYDRREAVINNPDQFTIRKLNDAREPLPGAKFRLTNDHNPAFARDFVTGANGEVVVDNLIGAGNLDSYASIIYTLEEIEAPVGHELAANRIWKIKVVKDEGSIGISVTPNTTNDTYETIWDWVIDLFDPETDYDEDDKVLTVVNNRKKAEISVKKTVNGLDDAGYDDYITNLRDAQYTFELYIDDVKQDELTVTANDLDKVKNFTKGVPYGSTYKVVEVASGNPGFTVSMSPNAENTVGISSLEPITVEATNTYNIVDGDDLVLDIIKVSTGRTATPLSGAKFELYNSADVLMESYTSGKDGKFQIKEIKEPGVYELLESVAPSGYYKLYSPITITASYAYEVGKDGNNNPVIVKSLVATVAGSTSYQVYDNNDTYYGIKNTPITKVSKTGDETDLLFWGGMTTASILCMAMLVLFFLRKKGKYQK